MDGQHLLFILLLTCGLPARSQRSSRYRDEISRCAEQGELYLPAEDACFPPLGQGPCPQGQMVALSPSSGLGKCRDEPCEDPQMVPGVDGRCVSRDFHRDCRGKGGWMRWLVTGEAECGCQAGWGRLAGSADCVQHSSRGSCSRGEIARGPANPLCSGKLDTIVTMSDNTTYAFVGRQYWRLTSFGVAPGYPRDISRDWGGMPGNIDAAFTISSKTYFFKGSKYWRFKEIGQLETSREVSRTFNNVPEDLDAALYMADKKQLFFFKGATYCKYDFGSKVCGDPVSLASFPRDMDAALTDSTGDTYIFKDGEYYSFDAKHDPPQQAGASWFGCGGDQLTIENGMLHFQPPVYECGPNESPSGHRCRSSELPWPSESATRCFPATEEALDNRDSCCLQLEDSRVICSECGNYSLFAAAGPSQSAKCSKKKSYSRFKGKCVRNTG